MRIRTSTGLALGLILGLAACDGSVQWPGFETPEPPPTETETPQPTEPEIVPVEPAPELPDTSTPDEPFVSDPPVTDPTPPPTEPETGTDTLPDEGNAPTDSTTDPDETGEETPDPTGATDETAPDAGTDEPEGTTTTDPTESEDGAQDASTTPETGETPDPAPVDTTPPAQEPEPTPIVPPAFSYHAPGDLLPGSGTGSPDRTVYAPDMVFPILTARAFPQSMVWKFGGGIGGGDECDPRNYEYPWQDNFCEKRSRNNGTPSCPVARVHLGQDIRVGDAAGCNAMRREYRNNARGIARYRVVAAEDGIISHIGRYTVTLRSGPRIYRYLHMNMRALQVSLGDTISAGQHLGYVSKDFGGTPTTFHLHFEIKVNTPDGGWEFVPPYTSLVDSYARREAAPGEEIPRAVGVASTGPPIPEGFIIIE